MKKEHWENIYNTKARNEVSWFREHLDTSLSIIERSGVAKSSSIIDVGGGNSTLMDDLLERGFTDLAALDISEKALNDIRERLARKADNVKWIASDITKAELPQNRYDLWHDRAVFHFLTDADDRAKYISLLKKSLKPGGCVIIAAFAQDGPKKCSGLDIVQYSPEMIHKELGEEFEPVLNLTEEHRTPFDTTQNFVYCLLRKRLL